MIVNLQLNQQEIQEAIAVWFATKINMTVTVPHNGNFHMSDFAGEKSVAMALELKEG